MSFFRTGLLIVSACFWLMYGTSAFASPLEQSVESPLKAGAIAVGEGRYNEALQQFTQSLEQFPAIGYGNRCLVHLQMQHYSLAIEDCTASLKFSQNPEVMLNLGLAYEQSGEHALAITQYESIISANLADYRVHYNLALAKAATGDHQAAVDAYTRALRELPTSRSAASSTTSSTASSTASLTNLPTDNLPTDNLSTDQANIYRDRGASYLVLANYVAAVADFNAAISRNRDDLWTYFNRGCAYHRSNNFLPALQDFNWVIARDDRNAHAYFNRGIIYARLGQADAAIKNLEQALQRFPANAHTTNVVIPVHQAQQLIERLKLGQTGSSIFSILSSRAVSS